MSYVADLQTEWADYTEKHKEVREIVEKRIDSFLEANRQNPLAIRGPFGQGKTQLLLHIFKYVWQKGGIAFYTTLDRLLPTEEMGPSDFSNHVDSLIRQSLDKLESADIGEVYLLPFQHLKDYVSEKIKDKTTKHNKVVLLLDEMEQSYKKLLGIVKTDDRSPFRGWLDNTQHFPVAAFAPLSYYEALQGEADKRRWEPLLLPPITPSILREKKLEVGNFAWWISRGRLGISQKVMDIIEREDLSKYKSFEELAKSVGDIAGVPSIDLNTLARFSDILDFVLKIFPSPLFAHSLISEGEIVDRTQFMEVIKDSLKDEKWGAKTIEYFMHYFQIITDAVSANRSFLVPDNPDNLRALLGIAVDLAIEWETAENEDVREIIEKVGEFEDQARFTRFFYTKVFGRIKKLTKGKGSILPYKKLIDLFPMPITSPAFGKYKPNEAREFLLSKTTYDYVSKDEAITERGIVTFLYFLNEVKLEEFLKSDEVADYLQPSKGLVCLLFMGETKQVELSGIAEWLKKANRFRIEVLPTKILGDFLTSFVAHMFEEEKAEGYISDLRSMLSDQAEELMTKDKELSRRITHYLRMLDDFVRFLPDFLSLEKDKYLARTSRDGVRMYGTRYTKFTDVVGLAFVEREDELKLVYRLRQMLHDSEELRGLRSGISGLLKDASVTKTGLSGVIGNIRTDFQGELTSLITLANLVNEESFTKLSEQAEAKVILKGLYKFVGWKTSTAKSEEVGRSIADAVEEVRRLKRGIERIVEVLVIHIRDSKSERNMNRLEEIGKIHSEAVVGFSNYVKSLLIDHIEAILSDFKDQILHEDQGTLSKWQGKVHLAKNIKEKRKKMEELNEDVFDWIFMKRDDVLQEIDKGYREAIDELTRYQQNVEFSNVDGLEWTDFERSVDEIISLMDKLQSIDQDLKKTISLAKEMNEELKKRARM